jgi:hypothetical protein
MTWISEAEDGEFVHALRLEAQRVNVEASGFGYVGDEELRRRCGQLGGIVLRH